MLPVILRAQHRAKAHSSRKTSLILFLQAQTVRKPSARPCQSPCKPSADLETLQAPEKYLCMCFVARLSALPLDFMSRIKWRLPNLCGLFHDPPEAPKTMPALNHTPAMTAQAQDHPGSPVHGEAVTAAAMGTRTLTLPWQRPVQSTLHPGSGRRKPQCTCPGS